MIELILTSCLATGLFLLLVMLPFRSTGSRPKQVAWALVITPLAACFAFGALREALKEHPVTVGLGSVVVLILIVSFAANVMLRLRKNATRPPNSTRIRQKRVIPPPRRSDDILSAIRDQLRDRDA